MAERHLRQLTGSFNWTDAVWAATPTGAPGSAATPADGDEVYLTQGNATLNGSDQTATELAKLVIKFGGNIGSPGSTFQIDANVVEIRNTTGDMYIAINSLPTPTDELFICYPAGGTIYFNGATRTGNILLGNIGSFRIVGCTLTGGSVFTAGMSVVNDSTIGGTFAAYGGIHYTTGALVNTVLNGGATLIWQGGLLTSLEAYNRSVLDCRVSGTISNLLLFPSAKASARFAPGPITVTNSEAYFGCQFFDDATVTITYTNPTVDYR